jgi:hypothetical protein
VNILKWITGGVIKETGDAIDKIVTSDEERLTLRNELAAIGAKAQAASNDVEKMIQENVSARHAADMQSDNKLSKNIRPLSLIALTVITLLWGAIGLIFLDEPEGVTKITDSVKLTIWLAFLELLTVLDLLAFGFYFGGRSIEKAAGKVTSTIMGYLNQMKPAA